MQLCAVTCSPLLPCVNLSVRVGRRYQNTWFLELREGRVEWYGKSNLLEQKNG